MCAAPTVQSSGQVSSTASNLPTKAQANKAPQAAVVLLLGLDGAGKTTLLGTLQGEKDPHVRPSVGFKPVTMMLGDQLKVKALREQLGGYPRPRLTEYLIQKFAIL